MPRAADRSFDHSKHMLPCWPGLPLNRPRGMRPTISKCDAGALESTALRADCGAGNVRRCLLSDGLQVPGRWMCGTALQSIVFHLSQSSDWDTDVQFSNLVDPFSSLGHKPNSRGRRRHHWSCRSDRIIRQLQQQVFRRRLRAWTRDWSSCVLLLDLAFASQKAKVSWLLLDRERQPRYPDRSQRQPG